MIVSNVKKCKQRFKGLQYQISSLLGLTTNLIEITPAAQIKKGLRMTINIFITRTKAIDMNIDKDMHSAQQSGELAEIIKASWKLKGVPAISNIQYKIHESKEQKANTIMITLRKLTLSLAGSGPSGMSQNERTETDSPTASSPTRSILAGQSEYQAEYNGYDHDKDQIVELVDDEIVRETELKNGNTTSNTIALSIGNCDNLGYQRTHSLSDVNEEYESKHEDDALVLSPYSIERAFDSVYPTDYNSPSEALSDDIDDEVGTSHVNINVHQEPPIAQKIVEFESLPAPPPEVNYTTHIHEMGEKSQDSIISSRRRRRTYSTEHYKTKTNTNDGEAYSYTLKALRHKTSYSSTKNLPISNLNNCESFLSIGKFIDTDLDEVDEEIDDNVVGVMPSMNKLNNYKGHNSKLKNNDSFLSINAKCIDKDDQDDGEIDDNIMHLEISLMHNVSQTQTVKYKSTEL